MAYPLKVTPYYAGLMRDRSADDPIARQVVPSKLEENAGGAEDPLGESRSSPLPGMIHAYEDRVLVMPTALCLVNCRHCNRRWTRNLLSPSGNRLDMLAEWVGYVEANPLVREVLVTGGDPLALDDDEVEEVLSAFRRLEQVEVIRIGTRVPVVMPARVTARLSAMLKAYPPLFLHTQFNCSAECTPEASKALGRLVDAGAVLGNQMVLLAGINDSADEIAAVNRWLVRHRCRPYYLFLAEQVKGTAHFQVPLSRALEIADELHRTSSGLAIPRIVVDTPGRGGKVPLSRDRIETRNRAAGIIDLQGRWVELEVQSSIPGVES